MRVPVAAPTRLGAAEGDAVRAAIEGVLSGTQWILGSPVADFEAAWGAAVGYAPEQVVGVANGTDALVIAFGALGLPAGSGVLVAADEGGYAAGAARIAGLVPWVYDTGDFGPSVADLDAAVRPDVRTLVLTHLHGNPAGSAEVDAWRRAHGLVLVEDCAQAHGLVISGRHVGVGADAAAFSFYPTKNLGAIGDGGAVMFAAREHADAARELRQYGWGERYRVTRTGGRNSRLDALQAAVLLARLPYLDAHNRRRREIAARYAEVLPILTHDDSVHHHAVALLEDRTQVAAALAEAGVETAVHYPWLDQEMPGLEIVAATTVRAARRRDLKLTLPCFPEMSDGEIDHVLSALEHVIR